MKSGGPPTPPDPDPLVFFLDRGLGIHHVANALRAAGQVALPMSDVYGDAQAQLVSDDDWIKRASDEGWIALTKDCAIARHHQDALSRSTLRVFALNNANLQGPVMAERYANNLHRILRRAQQPGPYVYVVGPAGLEKRWPRD
jgi:hypothetical protein